MIKALTLHQLRCFDAVVRHGSFQAAADQLYRSQPTVFAAVKSLEAHVGLQLLDRSGYRVVPTPAGRSFHERVKVSLLDFGKLEQHALQIGMGRETELSVVIGDLCPLAPTLALLRRFFDDNQDTRLHLHFETLTGPWERLRDGDADLVFHHGERTDPALDYTDLQKVRLIPVVAPGFLAFPIDDTITQEQMRDYVQCIIRDSARQPVRDYYVLEGARKWTVSDQLMKKEVILQAMGWGHMPDFLIEAELASGRLLPITGKYFRGGEVNLLAARRRHVAHGPVAQQLWQYVAQQAPAP